ncbi:MAG TPA: AMP-binding protein, partial [Dermatophilaceae bacterium]
MNEFSVPPCYVSDPNDNLTDDIFDHAEHWPDQAGFSRRAGDQWVPVTYREAAEQVTRMAAGLIASGVEAGDRVALFSRTRFE